MHRTLAFLAAACAACGGSSTSSPDASPADAVPGVPDAMPLLLQGKVASYAGGPSLGAGVSGAQLCAGHPDQTDCTVTDANGHYALSVPFLPGNLDAAFTATASGYLETASVYHEVAPVFTYPATQPVWTDAYATSYYGTQAGFTYPDATHAFVKAVVTSPTNTALDGATVSIAGAAEGPVYTNGTVPTHGLSATTSDGVADFGGVAPGRFTVTVHRTGQTCGVGPSDGWPSATAGSVDAFAFAGAMTFVRVQCS
jgi:hypothetical protein